MFKYIILGIVQGLTEFFPVSSSGHLVILQRLFGMNSEQLALSLVLHLGTTLALIVFFFKDIIGALGDKKTLFLIIIVTIITGVIGISGKDFFERLFLSSDIVAVGLFITGLMLILTKKFMYGKNQTPGPKDALILGITQGIAIVPGISRSGITISTLLFRGMDKNNSFRFSFLASIPAVLGAALLEARDITACRLEFDKFLVGFIFSFLAGILALWLLRIILNKAKLYYFGYYCIIIAVITLIFIK
jgi:undecaprenyl-diphosphatase